MAGEWYIGPAGDLKQLVCPEINLAVSDVRYGGVHQAISGARIVDVTGTKQDLALNFTFLDESDYRWLQALQTRHIPGPHRLINPLRKNRLTVQAASVNAQASIRPGVKLSAGVWNWVNDWPTAAGYGMRSLEWSSRTASSTLKFDSVQGVPLFPLEQFTGSVYIKGNSAIASGSLTIDYYDRYGVFLSSATPQAASVTTSWARYTITRTAPANAATAVLGVTATATTTMRVAAAQLESGSSASAWDQGGGAPLVLVDQLPSTSPRFPLMNCSVTLLEA
jgi:hypothetical protein